MMSIRKDTSACSLRNELAEHEPQLSLGQLAKQIEKDIKNNKATTSGFKSASQVMNENCNNVKKKEIPNLSSRRGFALKRSPNHQTSLDSYFCNVDKTKEADKRDHQLSDSESDIEEGMSEKRGDDEGMEDVDISDDGSNYDPDENQEFCMDEVSLSDLDCDDDGGSKANASDAGIDDDVGGGKGAHTGISDEIEDNKNIDKQEDIDDGSDDSLSDIEPKSVSAFEENWKIGTDESESEGDENSETIKRKGESVASEIPSELYESIRSESCIDIPKNSADMVDSEDESLMDITKKKEREHTRHLSGKTNNLKRFYEDEGIKSNHRDCLSPYVLPPFTESPEDCLKLKAVLPDSKLVVLAESALEARECKSPVEISCVGNETKKVKSRSKKLKIIDLFGDKECNGNRSGSKQTKTYNSEKSRIEDQNDDNLSKSVESNNENKTNILDEWKGNRSKPHDRSADEREKYKSREKYQDTKYRDKSKGIINDYYRSEEKEKLRKQDDRQDKETQQTKGDQKENSVYDRCKNREKDKSRKHDDRHDKERHQAKGNQHRSVDKETRNNCANSRLHRDENERKQGEVSRKDEEKDKLLQESLSTRKVDTFEKARNLDKSLRDSERSRSSSEKSERDSEKSQRDSIKSRRDSGRTQKDLEEPWRNSGEFRRDSKRSQRNSESSERDSEKYPKDSEKLPRGSRSQKGSEKFKRDVEKTRRNSENSRRDSEKRIEQTGNRDHKATKMNDSKGRRNSALDIKVDGHDYEYADHRIPEKQKALVSDHVRNNCEDLNRSNSGQVCSLPSLPVTQENSTCRVTSASVSSMKEGPSYENKKQVADWVVKHLMPHYKNDGISGKDLFKSLARQMSHNMVEMGPGIGKLKCISYVISSFSS